MFSLKCQKCPTTRDGDIRARANEEESGNRDVVISNGAGFLSASRRAIVKRPREKKHDGPRLRSTARIIKSAGITYTCVCVCAREYIVIDRPARLRAL